MNKRIDKIRKRNNRRKINVQKYLWETIGKIDNLIVELGRLMPNIGEPGSKKRRIMRQASRLYLL